MFNVLLSDLARMPIVPVVRRPTGRPAGIAIVVAFLAGPDGQ
ncbi:MAG: hypothetical protein WBL53_03410 [Pseudonocardiaceae bacterium]